MRIPKAISRRALWVIPFGLPLAYAGVASIVMVRALAFQGRATTTDSLTVQNARENEAQTQRLNAMEARISAIESLKIRETMTELQGKVEVSRQMLSILTYLAIVAITGIIVNLGLSVFRLTVQLRAIDQTFRAPD